MRSGAPAADSTQYGKVHIVNALRTIREHIRFHTVHLFYFAGGYFKNISQSPNQVFRN